MKFCKTFAFLVALTPAVAMFTEDFESFAPGDVINEIVSDNGFTIGVVAMRCSEKAMIFDSASPTGSDSDLMTPGPGVNNTVPKGNILIVSEDGDSGDPDDCGSSGILKFKFSPHAFVSSIGLLGHKEGARILVIYPSGASYAIDVPATSDNGYASIPINDVVRKIKVKLKGSGAVTELEYAAPITINFDDIIENVGVDDIPADGYMGLNWDNFGVFHKDYASGSGYDYGTTSGEYTAYNLFGHPASFSATADTGIFSLHSFQATAAWNDDNVLDINGYKGTELVATMSVPLQTSGPTLVVFGSDFTDLTKVEFVQTRGYVALDDMLISF
jgi:hypothetical protein